MSQCENGWWTTPELSEKSSLDAGTIEETITLLLHHDVMVKDEEKGTRFASELMRRWVARKEDNNKKD